MGDLLQNPFGTGSQAVPVKGTVSGGSKPTPQTKLMTTGSGTHGGSKTHTPGSAPKNTQKLRG